MGKEIARRQAAEEQRKKYFFNEKQRAMGMDVGFIATQIEQKQKVQEAEKNLDAEYKQEMESFVNKLSDLDEQRQALLKQKAIKVGNHQRDTNMTDRDTWHLNNPLTIKQDQPPRTADDQIVPSCALQKFDGEDLDKTKRIKSQQKEIQQWSKQIISEKNKSEQNTKDETFKYVRQRDECLAYLDKVEAAKNNKLIMEKVLVAQTNIAQMREKENKQMVQQQIDASKSEKEVSAMKECAFLNETFSSTLRD